MANVNKTADSDEHGDRDEIFEERRNDLSTITGHGTNVGLVLGEGLLKRNKRVERRRILEAQTRDVEEADYRIRQRRATDECSATIHTVLH